MWTFLVPSSALDIFIKNILIRQIESVDKLKWTPVRHKDGIFKVFSEFLTRISQMIKGMIPTIQEIRELINPKPPQLEIFSSETIVEVDKFPIYSYSQLFILYFTRRNMIDVIINDPLLLTIHSRG